MGRKVKIPYEEKLMYVTKYLNKDANANHIASLIGIDRGTFIQWVRNYEVLGVDGLIATCKNTSYSTDLKRAAIKDYLDGLGSQVDICKKYGIRAKRQLQDWIMKYNNHEELKASRNGETSLMIKGRKTSIDERIEIVKYCIEHQNNYNETAHKYNVSYQQVRNWVVKFEVSGVDALSDRRGKRKAEDEITELEKLKAQNRLLEAKNRRMQMEIDFLKKLEEIERRRH